MEIRTSREKVDWEGVAKLLNASGLSEVGAEMQEKIFRQSYAVAFAYEGGEFVGCARAISDGVCQAAIFNVAVREPYRGKGVARQLVASLLAQLEGCIVTLYTHPRFLGLYEKLGFRRQKTGFVAFTKGASHAALMEREGFLLKEGFRFEGETGEV